MIDSKGEEREDLSRNDLLEIEDKAKGSVDYFYNNEPYYLVYKSNNAIIIPISGKGLWSTLYGYFALDLDLETVKGITFYKHGETPGLGAEVEKSWFQNNFIGKRFVDDEGNLVGIRIVKGKADPNSQYEVDGISGATITSKGLESFLVDDLKKYEPFFQKIRSGEV